MLKRLCVVALWMLMIAACDSPNIRVEQDIEVPVEVEELTMKSIEKFVETTGTVEAKMEVLLKSESSGYYRLGKNPETSSPFVLGDFVKKGQVLVYLDNPEQVNTIKIESHKLNLENTQREHEKQNSLYEKGGVTLRELKTAERSYVDAKYAYENALIQLEKLKVQAPFEGILVDIPYYTAGVNVPANSDMSHLMDYRALTMEVNLPGKLLGTIEVGQVVRVMNYTMPDKKFLSVITQVAPALDPDTRTFKAKVHIANPDWLLRPGMFVKAEIVTEYRDNTVVVSKDVVLARRNLKTVFIIDRGVARERRIETGLESPDELEVLEGLSVGDQLVVEGFETLRSGSRVKITQ